MSRSYGAYVYRNEDRCEARENQVPYAEPDRGDADPRLLSNEITDCAASLGTGRVRLCARRGGVLLFVDGRKVDLDPYQQPPLEGHEEDCLAVGTIEGNRFLAIGYFGKMYLQLIEPDGTLWQARTGYLYGPSFGPDRHFFLDFESMLQDTGQLEAA